MTTIEDVWAATAGGSTLIPRDRWGRPLVIPPQGGKPVAYTRVTTLAGTIDDTYALQKWKQRQTAVGITSRRDLGLRVASLGRQPDDGDEARTWKAQMDDVCEQAMEAAGSSAKATIGTALHSFTEAIDRGVPVSPPPDYEPHLEAYRHATAGWRIDAIECFLVCDELKVAGTADRIVALPGWDGRFIADVKTGSIDYPHKMAAQLAVYAHSMAYDPATGERADLDVRTDTGLIIALDQATGTCQVHWINLDAGWEAVKLAVAVQAWRKRRDLLTRHTVAVPTLAQLVAATSVDELVAIKSTATAWTTADEQALTMRLVELLKLPA